MKTLHDHVIVYDADCPLCKAYTGAFIRNKMLDKWGRLPFHKIPGSISTVVDMDRARNEIALVNTKDRTVMYGMDSLFAIIGNTFPVFRPLFRNAVFRWFISRLYKFISYNRKVIAAVKPSGNISCTPDFNLKYRILYLIVTLLFTGTVLNGYSHLLTDILPAGNTGREFAICAGQIFFQGTVILLLKKQKLMDYLGNMMTVSAIGGLLLLPALAAHKLFYSIPAAFYPAWFVVVVGIMLLEHIRRTKLLSLNIIPSATWILYRVLILVLILAG